MRVPRAGVIDLRRRAAGLLACVADVLLVAIPARLAAIRRHDESERAAHSTRGHLAYRAGQIRLRVAHPDEHRNPRAVAIQFRAQRAGLAHRELVVRRAAAQMLVMAHDFLVALFRERDARAAHCRETGESPRGGSDRRSRLSGQLRTGQLSAAGSLRAHGIIGGSIRGPRRPARSRYRPESRAGCRGRD